MSIPTVAIASRLRGTLRRDGVREGAQDEARQQQLCQIMWTLRHIVVIAGLLMAVAAGDDFTNSALLAVLATSQLASNVLTRRRPRFGAVLAVADAVFLIGLALAGLPHLVVFVVAVAMLGWVATFRPVPAIATGALAITAVIVRAATRDDVTLSSAVAAFAMLGTIFIIRTVRLNMGARRSSEREHLIAERIDAIVWEDTGDGSGGLTVSAAAERLLGYPTASWQEPNFWSRIVHQNDQHTFAAMMTGDSEHAATVRLQDAGGSWRWIEVRATKVSDRSGRSAFTAGVLLDRTEQVEAEREALMFGQLVASSPIGQMLLRHEDGPPIIEAANAATQRILALDPSAVGTPLYLHQRAAIMLRDIVLQLGTKGPVLTTEVEGADGRTYQTVGRRIDEDSCSIDFLDVTERVETAERLHEQARRDELTGLPNRRAFVERLEASLAASPDAVVSVLMIDLDDFKDINDSLGHEIGDKLLIRIAERLHGSARVSDLVARLGGDEFAMVLDHCTPESAVRTGRRVIDALSKPVIVDDLRLRARASIGIACGPIDSSNATELVRCADVAMYLAKGRKSEVERYQVRSDSFDPDRPELVTELEVAIASDQLVLHHQPLLDLVTSEVVGTEALARWQHPERGLIPADKFIELAEVSGQIKNLTRWVIRQALTDLAGLGPAAHHLDVSVNLSVRNLYEPDLVDWLEAELRHLGVDSSRLVVEITETTVMEDQHTAIETIERLRAIGVRTWIDDFGTGHSSFARLRSLPVHGIKIDRAFVSAAIDSETDRVILRGIIDLVHSLGLQSIAEGVESEACLENLKLLGCQTAQGFHINRPAPIDQLGLLLAARVEAVDLEAPAGS